MKINLNEIITWITSNGLWDLIKVLFWWIFWRVWHRLYNKALIKGNKNKIEQKGPWNISKIKWHNNSIKQSK
jgi:hypothetical protein